MKRRAGSRPEPREKSASKSGLMRSDPLGRELGVRDAHQFQVFIVPHQYDTPPQFLPVTEFRQDLKRNDDLSISEVNLDDAGSWGLTTLQASWQQKSLLECMSV